MHLIALLPLLIAALVALRTSPASAFLGVYLPVLLLLPEGYRAVLPGLPDPTLSQSAALGVMAVFLLKNGLRWQFSFTDFLVAGFAFCVAYSEYLNAGYSEAQNLMFDMLAWVVFPYVLAKALIVPQGLSIPFARRLVFLVFVAVLIAPFEFKFGMNPYQMLFNPLFPGQGTGWVTTFRHGMARVAGPYSHAILAGVMMVVAYRIQRWLEWNGGWETTFRNLPGLPLSKGRIITLALFAGALMTIARGPWIGGLLGGLTLLVGRSRNRARAAALVLIAVVLIGVPAATAFYSYVSVGRAGATTSSQESAAYRKELIDKYTDIALEKATWGWGRNTWPRVAGMPSIDNYYLLLALMHGVVALGFLLALFGWMMTRLYRRGMRTEVPVPGGCTLAFTLLGVYLIVFISIATVYLGQQTIPMLFVITGWAEAYLLSRAEPFAGAAHVVESQSRHQFIRVMS